MAQGKAETDRKTVVLAVETIRYLEDLAAKGTHGTDVPDIIRRFVENGVRRAISKGWIEKR